MSTVTVNKSIDYDKNLRKMIGWERADLKVLIAARGILKGTLGKSPVSQQRSIRNEWEKRSKNLQGLLK